jgi:dTDP-4-amino-4,6-dideoxygalactose transaminase
MIYYMAKENKQYEQNFKDFAAFKGREMVLTMFARNALYLGLREIIKMAPSRKPIALLPAYNCGDEIGPFQKLGFENHFYAIKGDLSVDMDDLFEKKTTVHPDVVLVTHYFGFPQMEIEKIKSVCEENKAFLIEDCAHAFQSEFNGKELGSFGDMAIFSLRKFFNIPDGGALRINNPNISCPQTRESDGEAAEKSQKYFRMIQNKEVLPGTTPGEIFKKLDYTLNPLTGERFVAEGGYELGMPSSTKAMLQELDISDELKRRKKMFMELKDNFEKIVQKPDKLLISSELAAINPSYFPFLVHDSQKFLSFLRERNIHMGNPFWTNFSCAIHWEDFPDTAGLKNSIYIINLAKDIPEQEQIIFFNALNDYNREFPEI